MPRADRTFTDADLVRFWARNLDDEEQKRVAFFFFFLVQTRAQVETTLLQFVGSLIGIIPLIGPAFEVAVDAAIAARNLRDVIGAAESAENIARESGIDLAELASLFNTMLDIVEDPDEGDAGGDPGLE